MSTRLQGRQTHEQAALTFWGAAGTVTGSKFLLEAAGARVLVDCGLFQGPKTWRLRNWETPGFLDGQGDEAQGAAAGAEVAAAGRSAGRGAGRGAGGSSNAAAGAESGRDRRLDAIVLTHAHLDHSGFLPRLVAWEAAHRPSRHGPEWRAYATAATVDLLRVMLPDSAHIQEEDAAFANKKGFSKHDPALPLYTTADAYASLRLLRTRDYDEAWEVAPGLSVTLEDAGHLVGSAIARFALPDGRQVLFSGDLGRYVNPLLRDPAPPGAPEVVVMESTYGGRLHAAQPPEEGLAEAVAEAVRRDGVLLVPAFAVGRTQDLLYALRELMLAGRVPDLPIYVDSPMAIEATRIFLAHEDAHDPELYAPGRLGQRRREALRWSAEGGVHYVQTRRESQALNDLKGTAIIIAASGMATGGRILHHLKHRLPQRRTVVLLVGYQAQDTRGRLLLEGARAVKIHGEEVPVHAEVRFVDGFSAHADQGEMLRWLGGLTRAPQRLFLVHGEPEAAQALAEAIRARFGWTPETAAYGQRVVL
jgi:metallo-beta-lactamase family protein